MWIVQKLQQQIQLNKAAMVKLKAHKLFHDPGPFFFSPFCDSFSMWWVWKLPSKSNISSGRSQEDHKLGSLKLKNKWLFQDSHWLSNWIMPLNWKPLTLFSRFCFFVIFLLSITNQNYFSPVISQCSIEHKLHYNIFQAQRSLLVLREAKKFPEIIWLLSLDQRFKLIASGINEAQSWNCSGWIQVFLFFLFFN